MGLRVAVVSARDIADLPCRSSLPEALEAFAPGYVVIANITSRHEETLSELSRCGFGGTVLVEKPLFTTSTDATRKPAFPVMVAYNLRFHPVVRALREALVGKTILVAHAHVGQHLSQWRPGRTVADTYSAHRDQGGGVTRDLSHEFDLAGFLFGRLDLLAAHSARVGRVTVDSEDVAVGLFTAERCPLVTIQVDYLDHCARRRWVVVTEDETLEADLIGGTLRRNGETTVVPAAVDDSYRSMHAAALAGGDDVCTWEEGMEVVATTQRIAPR